MRGLDDYALACRRVGQRVVNCGATWWREVRPCYFRPILPFLQVPAGPAGLPYRAVLGGWQYPSYEGGDTPNSFVTYISFEDARGYRSENLRRCCRWELRSAEKRFVVRPLSNGAEFRARAHPIYLEFHERTRYGYLKNRTRKRAFDRWVDAEFADPGLVALGAWAGDSLVAVSLSRVVGSIWVYTSFFASDDAVRAHVANLLLHHLRSLAAADNAVTSVFVGMQKPGAGASKDAFFLHRGAVYVRSPAVLRVNPIAGWMLLKFRPDVWRRLRGDLDTASEIGTTPR